MAAKTPTNKATKTPTNKTTTSQPKETKPKAKPKANPKAGKGSAATWERVFVFTGEPLLSRLGLNEATQNHKARYADKSDLPVVLRGYVSDFGVLASPRAVVVFFPSAEQLRVMLDAIQADRLSPPALVLMCPGDAWDGRTSFALAASKNKRVFASEPILAGDRAAVEAHVRDWEAGTGTRLLTTARKWVVDNAPTCMAKVKGPSGKREVEAYDLQTLEGHLSKVTDLQKYQALVTGGESWLTQGEVMALCPFEHASDVWAFVRQATQGDAGTILRSLDDLGVGQADQGPLYLLAAQLEVMVSVRSLESLGLRGDAQIAARLDADAARVRGAYLLPSYEEPPATTAASVGEWRVRKARESTGGLGLARLSAQLRAVQNSLIDLRSSIPADSVIPRLALALAGLTDYAEPLSTFL